MAATNSAVSKNTSDLKLVPGASQKANGIKRGPVHLRKTQPQETFTEYLTNVRLQATSSSSSNTYTTIPKDGED